MDKAHRQYLRTYRRIKSADTIAMSAAGKMHLIGTPKQFLDFVKIDENHDDELVWKKRVKTAVPELNPKSLYASYGWSGRFKKFTFDEYNKINQQAKESERRYLRKNS